MSFLMVLRGLIEFTLGKVHFRMLFHKPIKILNVKATKVKAYNK